MKIKYTFRCRDSEFFLRLFNAMNRMIHFETNKNYKTGAADEWKEKLIKSRQIDTTCVNEVFSHWQRESSKWCYRGNSVRVHSQRIYFYGLLLQSIFCAVFSLVSSFPLSAFVYYLCFVSYHWIGKLSKDIIDFYISLVYLFWDPLVISYTHPVKKGARSEFISAIFLYQYSVVEAPVDALDLTHIKKLATS